jgi:prepilin-type N-terminal cleavage/methylation domain-containing protein
MLNKIKKSNKGFTIIEVMIVLAIAGLILLIVFLAVPALQRSSRNTQRKNDTTQISAAIANFISNNGGSIPTAVGITSDVTQEALFCVGAAPTGVTQKQSSAFSTGCTTTDKNFETAKLGYYKPADNKIFLTNTIGSSISPPVALGAETATAASSQSIIIDLGYGCNSTSTGASTTVNSRSAAILYVTETGSGNGSMQCVEQ